MRKSLLLMPHAEETGERDRGALLQTDADKCEDMPRNRHPKERATQIVGLWMNKSS